MFLVPVVAVEPQSHVDLYRTQQERRNTRNYVRKAIAARDARARMARHYYPAGV